VYLGYKIIIDPLFVDSIGRDVTDPRGPNVAGPSNNPDITITDDRSDVGKTIGTFFKSTIKETTRIYGRIRYGINPFNWFIAGSDTGLNTHGFKNFMERQNVMETAERKLYPFTTLNPYLPWYDQLRINLFGESVFENLKRFKAMEYADRVANTLSVSKGKFKEVVGGTPNMWAETAASTNFATPIPRGVWADQLQVYSKLKSIPSTPTMIPTSLPVVGNILQDVSEWKTHEKVPFTTDTDQWMKDWKLGNSSKITTELLNDTTIPVGEATSTSVELPSAYKYKNYYKIKSD